MMEITLTQGKVALVDDEDYEALINFRWQAHVDSRVPDNWYAQRTDYGGGKKVHVAMHRVILGALRNSKVDHVDGNGLNNQKSNLRLCSHTNNLRNMRRHKSNELSRYKGVSTNRGKWLDNLTPGRQKSQVQWRARIRHQGKLIFLGRFDSQEEAARVYDKAATELFGEYAHLNFPGEA